MSTKKGTLDEFVRSHGVLRMLHPKIARLAVEGYEDEISAAQTADDAFYRQFCCPSCGCTTLTKEFFTGANGQGVTWVEGEVTPQALLRCQNCRALFNPRSGIIVETGNHTPVFDETDLDPSV